MGKVSVLAQLVFGKPCPFLGCGARGEGGGLRRHAVNANARSVGDFSVGVDSFFDIGHRYNNSFRIPVWPRIGPEGVVTILRKLCSDRQVLLC